MIIGEHGAPNFSTTRRSASNRDFLAQFYSHFAKEHLPRLKWANQALEVEVTKVPKSAAEVWRPELELRFG